MLYCKIHLYMCVRGIDVASVCTIFRFNFGTVLTVWYFLFSILFVQDYCTEAQIHEARKVQDKFSGGTT